MEPTPERRPIITMINQEEYALDSETCAETEVTALLAFLGQLNSRWAIIDYNLFGEPQRLTTLDLKKDPNEGDLDHSTFLNGKAHELLCGTDVRIRLINPDALESNVEF